MASMTEFHSADDCAGSRIDAGGGCVGSQVRPRRGGAFLKTGMAVSAMLSAVASPLYAQPAGNVAQPGGPAPATSSVGQGVLAIRGVQGSSGGGSLASSDVEIDFVQAGRSVKHITTRFDEQGVVILTDVPVGPEIRPLVRIKYAGVTYQEVGPVMDAGSPKASMQVTVYETTETAPEWRIPMRHVMATPAAGGYEVSETVVVENPSDRTWLGGAANEKGRRPVVQLGLPPSAGSITLESGFHGWCCTEISGRTLTVQMPLMPGRASFKFSYRVPSDHGQSDLRIGAAATIQNATFFVPDDSSLAQPSGVEAQPSQDIGSQRMRMFSAKDVAPGMVAGVLLEASDTPAIAAAAPVADSTVLGVTIAAGVVVLGTGAFIYARSARRAASGIHIRRGAPTP